MLTAELLFLLGWLASLIDSSSLTYQFLGFLIYAIIVAILVSLFVYVVSWFERKFIAKVQGRHGPTFVGKYGILQNLADLVKLMAKSHFIPKSADKILFTVALPAILGLSIFMIMLIPLFPSTGIGEFANNLLLIFALFAFMPLFVFLIGVASGNKFGEISAQRSVIMILSYEIPIFLVIAGVGLLAHSFTITNIVNGQSKWYYIVLMPIGFVVMFIAMLAELERPPFDLREADSELISGWLTDVSAPYYSLALFLDYARLFLGTALISILFLGGWSGPWLSGIVWLLIKMMVLVIFIMIIRATTMRMRIDRLLNLGWFVLMPLAILNLIVTYIIYVMI